MTDYAGTIIPQNASSGGGERIQHGDAYVINSFCLLSTDPVIVTNDDNFHTVLSVLVQVSSMETIYPLTLSARWLITPERA